MITIEPEEWEQCPTCYGYGELDDLEWHSQKEICPDCDGVGAIKIKPEEVEVTSINDKFRKFVKT